jgi:UDP-N-acetylmuramate dehydrogenase
MRTAARERAGADLELELQCAGLFETELLDQCGITSTPEPSRPGYGWTGLLKFPDFEEAVLPRRLLDGPMLGYACRDEEFHFGITVRVEQLASLEEARCAPEKPFIRWTTRDENDKAFPLRPNAPGGAFVDRLWESSVSELFVGGGEGEGYLEFEVTQEGHWIALRFDSPRQRSAGHETPSDALWRAQVQPFSGKQGFGMELSFALLEKFVRSNALHLQCAASLGEGRYGLFPWWCDEGKPNFHQPGRFCEVRLV